MFSMVTVNFTLPLKGKESFTTAILFFPKEIVEQEPEALAEQI